MLGFALSLRSSKFRGRDFDWKTNKIEFGEKFHQGNFSGPWIIFQYLAKDDKTIKNFGCRSFKKVAGPIYDFLNFKTICIGFPKEKMDQRRRRRKGRLDLTEYKDKKFYVFDGN